ncbi:MAG: cysteine synthase [Candidatus Marinimicrobia bacterium]|nr:cysteine synthase [Candidatus Neomarinimicrobiota bacterium]
MKETINAISTIGNTPLIQLSKIVPPDSANVYIKLEYFNPTGSYKDRMALAMIEGAEKRGILKPGMTVVEYTGGSTGSSLAFICSVKGYAFHVISSNAFSNEKLDTMKAFGAKLEIIESQSGKIDSNLIKKMIERANQLSKKPDYFFTDQLNNKDIINGFEVMGNEIQNQSKFTINAFCAGIGTAGALMGVSNILLKSHNNTKVVALEPETAAFYSKGIKNGKHRVEGIGLGFHLPLLNKNNYHESRGIDEKEAIKMARKLARDEGIFGGASTGLNVVGALQLAKELGKGKNVITLACDTGLKYLNGDLYKG